MTVTAEFWRGRRILLTGHTGFKGAWLSLWLQQMGAEVVGYALTAPTNPSLFELARVAEGMVSEIGDIRDLPHLMAVMGKHRPTIVIHMAAQPLVRASYEDPVGTYATNVMGSVNVLEAVRRQGGVEAVLIITTDKCYSNAGWLWGYRESEPMGGHDPYASSKGCAELVTAAYRSSFFAVDAGSRGSSPVPVATARAGNVIGGGDWAKDRLVPDVLAAFDDQRDVVIRYPNAVRPWQHVLDPLAGYLTLVQKLVGTGDAFAEAWNFGPAPESERPTRDVVEILSHLWGRGAGWRLHDGYSPHEDATLRLDCSKARQRLGWTPHLPLHEALRWTVDWHNGYRNGADCRALTVGQIAAFQKNLSHPTTKGSDAVDPA